MKGLKNHQILNIGKYKNQAEKRLDSWRKKGFSRRLWSKDPTLWFPEIKPEISNRLGWLELPELMQEKLENFSRFAKQVKDEGISHVILLGMGGSSMTPYVFQKIFGNAQGYPELVVLDSTHPSAVLSVEDKLDLRQTLFLVSSKSGTTLETLSLFRYFWKKMGDVSEKPGHHFAAITDFGTYLMKRAQEKEFRYVFQSKSDVGGRYSALTEFGLVPAALIGMDLNRLLNKARIASENCALCVSEKEAWGLILGAALGEIVKNRNKLTFLASPSLKDFPDWLEQLIAESTGKDGKGIVPVVNEPLVSPDVYSEDRFFVSLSLEGDDCREFEEQMNSLEQLGHPVVRINLREKYDLGREILFWEVSVASAGSVLGIHPFNQPDVQLSKDFAQKAMEKVSEAGKKEIRKEETIPISRTEVLAEALKNWINQAHAGDYAVLQAFLPPAPDTSAVLQNIRLELLKHVRIATTVGYGPRFLHSTGQLHKGGPDTGLFLQIVDEPGVDLPIPETAYSFGTLIKAQALGDYLALKQRGRRVLRINLGTNVKDGLEQLQNLLCNIGIGLK